jgi:uncharacterized protein YqeY
MTLIEQIKTKQIEARKAGHALAASLLTTLLGEAAMVGKNANRETTDAEVVAVVKKFVKNIDETVEVLIKSGTEPAAFLAERAVLEQFLPVQMTEQAIRNVAAQFTSMPEFMKYMKENYAGQYDGKAASVIAKTVFG